MKVPVESNNMLIIDIKKKTYEILKTSDYNGKFETETIEKGSLVN